MEPPPAVLAALTALIRSWARVGPQPTTVAGAAFEDCAACVPAAAGAVGRAARQGRGRAAPARDGRGKPQARRGQTPPAGQRTARSRRSPFPSVPRASDPRPRSEAQEPVTVVLVGAQSVRPTWSRRVSPRLA